jgi:hypothetical protein
VGRLLNHDTHTVQVIDRDERLRSFVTAELREQRLGDYAMASHRDELGSPISSRI